MEYLILDFLNTDWIKRHKDNYDPLDDEEWIQEYFLKVFASRVNVDNKTVLELKLLREMFLNIIDECICGEIILKDFVSKINCHLRMSNGKRIINEESEEYDLLFKSNCLDLDDIIAELSFHMYLLVIKSDMQRIRICDNPDCRYIFYDRSKNKSKRHCYEGCANIMKVRRFRAKSK